MIASLSLKFVYLSVFLSISILSSSTGFANTLGEENDGMYQVISGTAISVSEKGVISLLRTNPATNEPQTIAIQQFHVIGFDDEMIQKISGERVSCIFLLDYRGVKFGDCGILVGERNNRQRIGILKYLVQSNPQLATCSEFERNAFQASGLEECPLEEK